MLLKGGDAEEWGLGGKWHICSFHLPGRKGTGLCKVWKTVERGLEECDTLPQHMAVKIVQTHKG